MRNNVPMLYLGFVAAWFCLLWPGQAAAQLTEADVRAACQAGQPLSQPGWSFGLRHTGYTGVSYDVRNPFPGRDPGDVWVELFFTVKATFFCQPVDPSGQARPEAPGFDVVIDLPTTVPVGDVLACQQIDGQSTTVFVFLGYPCPFRLDAGFVTGTSTVTGPYPVVVERDGPDCTVFRPETLGEGGLRHPIVIWGNGTGGVPTNYGVLTRFASHGLVAVAANTPQSGSGQEMLACLNWIWNDLNDPSSRFHRKLNPHRIASMGYSQGGGGAVMAGLDPRFATTIVFNPRVGGGLGSTLTAVDQQHAPMFMISGENDTITPTSHHQVIYNRTPTPAFWITVRGAGHDLNAYHFGAGLAWARWRLMGTSEMESVFAGADCRLCTDPAVIARKKLLP